MWVDRVCIKKYIETSPFHLVHGSEAIFLMQLGFPIMKMLQEGVDDPNAIQRRICQLIEVQQTREMLAKKD